MPSKFLTPPARRPRVAGAYRVALAPVAVREAPLTDSQLAALEASQAEAHAHANARGGEDVARTGRTRRHDH